MSCILNQHQTTSATAITVSHYREGNTIDKNAIHNLHEILMASSWHYNTLYCLYVVQEKAKDISVKIAKINVKN